MTYLLSGSLSLFYFPPPMKSWPKSPPIVAHNRLIANLRKLPVPQNLPLGEATSFFFFFLNPPSSTPFDHIPASLNYLCLSLAPRRLSSFLFLSFYLPPPRSPFPIQLVRSVGLEFFSCTAGPPFRTSSLWGFHRHSLPFTFGFPHSFPFATLDSRLSSSGKRPLSLGPLSFSFLPSI